MSRRSRAILASCLAFLFLLVSASRLHAQQNGVMRTLTLAERTYGENVNSIAAAPDGELWVAGFTCSTTLPTTADAVQRSWSGPGCQTPGGVGFFERMKRDGTIAYLSYWGGNSNSTIVSLATDASGYLYIGGWTQSSDFQTTTGAYDRTCELTGTCAQGDAYITKMAPDGSAVVFSTYLGGSDEDVISSVAVDSAGRVHVAGSTASTDFPVTSGAFQTTPARVSEGAWDAFYARLSADGSSLQYATYLGGTGYDTATGVALDAAGDAYVVGQTSSTDFPTYNAVTPHPIDQAPGFLVRFGSSGAVYSTYAPWAHADAVQNGFVYIAGAGVTELTAGTGSVTRHLVSAMNAQTIVLDQNHVAYIAGVFDGSDTFCPACDRYPATWDAAKRQLSGSDPNTGDFDAVLSIVDLRPQYPAVLYSTMFGGGSQDAAYAVMPDGSGGAFFGGLTQGMTSVNAQPEPPEDADVTRQSFVAHVSAQTVTMPVPPADIALYAYDPNGISPTAIAGDWKLEQDSSAAGGWIAHEPDQGAAKVTTPAAAPANYFELEFLADANVPYHLWLRMRADNDSYQNDSVWVQFSDSVDGGGSPVWRIGSTDGTAVSLEDCSGCGEQGWGWNDNGYGTAGTPVIFATSGWHTIRVQQREDGAAIDQIVLSSNRWATTAPGANKDDGTILPQSYALPSGNISPSVSITYPTNGETFTAPFNLTVNVSASDPDGTVSKVDLYENGQFITSKAAAPYEFDLGTMYAGTYHFTAIATDDQGASTTSAVVTITATGIQAAGIPPGWLDLDVGDTGATGSAQYSNGIFTLQGAGADVWGTSDAFNYVSTELSGDGYIVARVTTVSDEANWVKAGVMIRDGLGPSAAQAFMLVSHAKGLAFQRRTVDGGATVSTAGAAAAAPYWVKLVRSGNTISGFESADGRNWTFVGSDTFNMPTSVFVGLAVSSHVYGTLATAEFDSVQTSLPAPWDDIDVGNVPFRGTANYGGGTFNVTGSGADIWGTADAFHYVYRGLTGDGSITARVATVQDVAPWVKAGVMIRNTMDPASAQALVLVSAEKGVAFQRRQTQGGTSVSTAGSAAAAPHWIRLTRSGNTFTAYESADGTNWTAIGSDTIPMASGVFVGLAVTSHSTSSSATASFDHVGIQ